MTDVSDLFDRLTAGLPETSPTPGLALAGRRLRRRRRQRVVLATAAAVAVVAAGSAVASGVVREDRSPQVATADPTPTGSAGPASAVPAPPPGTRWVGQDRTIVAVPVDWAADETGCDEAEARPCVRALGPSGNVQVNPGTGVGVGANGCDEPLPPICYGRSDGDGMLVRVVVQATDAADQVTRILATRTRLPDGWTTVPTAEGSTLDQRVARYEAAGFEVVVEDRDRIEGDRVAVVPDLGAPIEQGGTITLGPAADVYADPAVLVAGQGLDAVFTADVSRGLAYILRGPDESRHLLVSGSNGGEPVAYDYGESGPINDIGILGRGRDRLVLPDDASPGRYELCTVDPDQVCTTLTVVAR